MVDYFVWFFSLAAACVALQGIKRFWFSSSSSSSNNGQNKKDGGAEDQAGYRQFRNSWLFVYYSVMLSDWMQGPYIYKLYQSYGFEESDIALLFIAGYLSSGIFGTVAGSLADKLGRRWGCLFFCIVYAIGCLTKLSHSFAVLMFGRLLGGIGTSLLFSVFEAWMVHSHQEHKYADELLHQTFSLATLGNGVIAIVAGFLSDFLVEATGSVVAPWMFSMAVLLLIGLYIWRVWGENYGDAEIHVKEAFANAVSDLCSNVQVPILGIVQSLFEASMYTFVFMWTPALESHLQPGESISHGTVFACFMISTMIGSTAFSLLSASHVSMETITLVTLLLSAIAHATPVVSSYSFPAFLLFEFCCGLYWPAISSLRSKYLPERSRSTLMNFFRVPLNLLVVLVLVRVQFMSQETVFSVTTLWLSIAALLQFTFRAPHE